MEAKELCGFVEAMMRKEARRRRSPSSFSPPTTTPLRHHTLLLLLFDFALSSTRLTLPPSQTGNCSTRHTLFAALKPEKGSRVAHITLSYAICGTVLEAAVAAAAGRLPVSTNVARANCAP